MVTLRDVKIHVRLSTEVEYKHCFIAESIASHSDILQALYKRFGQDLKIPRIYYKDADGDEIVILDENDFTIMVRKNTIKTLFVTLNDVFGKLTL